MEVIPLGLEPTAVSQLQVFSISSGFDVEPYALIEDTTAESQQSLNEAASMNNDTIGQSKPGERSGVLSTIVDRSPDIEAKIETSIEVMLHSIYFAQCIIGLCSLATYSNRNSYGLRRW